MSVATVARIEPSIVNSKIMMRLGHHAKVGSPPTFMGHDVSVSHDSPKPTAMPISPPRHASHHIQVALSISPNS